jgi:hypothetical protein
MNRLGKKPFVPDERDITFGMILNAQPVELKTPPTRFGHGGDYPDWHMLGNGPDDSVEPGFQGCGDCVFAAAAHETMLVNKIARHPVTITGKEVVADYSQVTGYIIGDDNSDQGTEVRAALKFRKNVGTLDSHGNRHKIGAYVSVKPKSWAELMLVTFWFTAAELGFEFPDTAMQQFDDGKPWTVDPNGYIEGGHDVPIVGASSATEAGAITWAKRQGMTRPFYEMYNDETWAIVFPEELRDGKTERGLDLTALNAALQALPR